MLPANLLATRDHDLIFIPIPSPRLRRDARQTSIHMYDKIYYTTVLGVSFFIILSPL